MKKLGFGLMRLPLFDKQKQTEIDLETLNRMVDTFLARGFTYFDTAAPYHGGFSEVAFRESVAKRYPRDAYTITDKLSLFMTRSEEDFPGFFAGQLERLGVDYVDYYWLHGLGEPSYRAEGEQLETGIKRVHRQSTNLTRVDEVNRVSRQVSAGKMSAQDALTRLRDIARMKGPMAGGLSILSAAVCAGGFALLFGGWLPEVGVSAVVAAIVQAFSLLLLRFHSRGIATNILGGLLTAMLPHLAARLCPGLITEAVIAGALMPLVPGIAMTKAVQDTMRGDMVSGLSHGVEALLTACMIAGGALLSPPLLRLLEGGGF